MGRGRTPACLIGRETLFFKFQFLQNLFGQKGRQLFCMNIFHLCFIRDAFAAKIDFAKDIDLTI